jgi:hypothetical protein
LPVLTPSAVRLSALVAAAVSAGYLWRAALDHQTPQKVLVSVPPALQFKPGAGAELFNSLSSLRTEATRIARQEALRAEQAHIAAALSDAASASGHASGSTSIAYIRTAHGAPSAHDSGSTGSGGSGHGRQPTLKPPKPQPPHGGSPKPKPPPPPPPTPPPPPPAPPAPPPPPPPPPPAGPPAPPPPPPVGSGGRPGWGKGDRNHAHTGPPGHSRRKYQRNGKSEQSGGEIGHQHGSGGGSWKHEDEQGNANQQANEEQQGNAGDGGGNQGGGSNHGGGNHGGGNQGGGHGNRH